MENQVSLGDLLEEFLDRQVIQESQVNVVHPVPEDLQEGKDTVFMVPKETKVTLAVQASKVRKDCSDATLETAPRDWLEVFYAVTAN